MKHIRKSDQGFTIVELMIATTVFSIVLLLVATGMLEVGRLFYKGTTNANTQEIARIVLEDVSQAIQFSGETITLPSASRPNRFCVGSRRYTFNRGVMYNGTNHIFTVDRYPTTCNDSTPANNLSSPAAGSRELMGRNMRLANIDVRCVNGPPTCPGGIYTITVRVVYGQDDLLDDANGTNARCRQDIRAGTQFCSVSELVTTVTRRVE